MYRKRVAGVAAVCFAVFAGIESTLQTSRSPEWATLLFGPDPRGASGELAGYYAIGTTAAAAAAAVGMLSLLSYVVFVASLWRMLTLHRPARAIASLLLASGLAGPAIAAAAIMRRWAASSATTTALAEHHSAYLNLRLLGGILIGITLLTVAAAGSTGAASTARVLPRWLVRAAFAIGGVIVVTCPLALITPSVGGAAHVSLVAGAAWVGVAGTRLLMPAPHPALGPRHRVAATATWLIFFVVAVAAGASGIALLAAPAATEVYFSWPLGPASVAALVGVNYLLAAVTYGLALRDGGPATRPAEAHGLLLAILALSVPVFATTILHASQFDFRRWQATLWIVLFAAVPMAASASLWLWRADGDDARPVPKSARRTVAVWGVPAVVSAALAALLLLRPSIASDLPDSPGPLAIRVLAGWLLFAATLAAWTAIRPVAQSRPARAVLPVLAAAWLIVALASWLT